MNLALAGKAPHSADPERWNEKIMEITCEHCGSQFCQISIGKKIMKRMRFCSKKCNQNSLYHKHTDYYANRYQEQKDRILKMCAEYREQDYVKELRLGYAEEYKENERQRMQARISKPGELEANKSRVRARRILLKHTPKLCCHCKSVKRINVHHINEDVMENSLINLCWLCSKCHGAVHSLVRAELKTQINCSIQGFQLNTQNPSETSRDFGLLHA